MLLGSCYVFFFNNFFFFGSFFEFFFQEGNSLPKLSTYVQAVAALESAQFQVVEHEDLAADELKYDCVSQLPWYTPLQGQFNLSLDGIISWRMTPVGRWITDKLVNALEIAKLAPEGTRHVTRILNSAADYLVKGGQEGLFTPMFYFLAKKPLV